MPFMTDNALDAALAYIRDNAAQLDICSAEPANYAGIAAVTLGNKAAPSIGASANGTVDGRKATVAAFTDGAVTATHAAASHWAIHDGVGELLAAGALQASQPVTSGNTFSLPAFAFAVRDAIAAA